MKLTPRNRTNPFGEDHLPMASMIDVVFLLLVFFLATSTFAVPESKLDAAPAVESAAAEMPALAPQIIEVFDQDGRDVYRLGEVTTTNPRFLTERLASLPKDPGVAIRVRDDASVAGAAAALQAAHDAGFTKRSYVPADR